MDRYAPETVSTEAAPEPAHEITECSRFRYAVRSIVWHLLTGFSVSGLCCRRTGGRLRDHRAADAAAGVVEA